MMDWLSADFIKALSAPAVLLLIALGLAYAGFKDRNSRINDAQTAAREAVERAERETERWREAYTASEGARERQAAGLREALEVARTATMAVEGLRSAMSSDRQTDGGH